MYPVLVRDRIAPALVSALLFVSGHPTILAAQSEMLADRPEVHTQASARRAVRANLATLTVQVSALGASPREAGGRVAARMDSILASLRALGIPKDSVWTANARGWYWQGRIEVVPGQQVWHNPPPGVAGKSFVTQDTAYRARDVVEIRIADMRKVGAVIDTLLTLRLTEISGPRFLATNTGSERTAALREATERARQQAATMAEAAGMKLGRLLRLSSTPGPSETVEFVGATVVSARTVGPPTSVLEPFVPLEVSVTARWELLAR